MVVHDLLGTHDETLALRVHLIIWHPLSLFEWPLVDLVRPPTQGGGVWHQTVLLSPEMKKAIPLEVGEMIRRQLGQRA